MLALLGRQLGHGIALQPWPSTLSNHPSKLLHLVTLPCTVSLHPAPYHSTLHPITPPLSLHPSPYHSTLHPITPPFTLSLHPSPYHSTLHPITPIFTLSLHPSPYHSTLHPITPPFITHAAETPVTAGHSLKRCRSNHCTSSYSPTHCAMIDCYPACIALCKHVPCRHCSPPV